MANQKRCFLLWFLARFITFGAVFYASLFGYAKSTQIDKTLYCRNEEMLLKSKSEILDPSRILIDRIVISKKKRKLFLLSHGAVFKDYDVTFGFGFVKGVKKFVKDGATPEGLYSVELKKYNSSYHRALKVSYPNDFDTAYAASKGLSPGSDIMIHGFPNQGLKGYEKFNPQLMHPTVNWTQGCIAMSNKEIEEVYALVSENTAIEICPL